MIFVSASVLIIPVNVLQATKLSLHTIEDKPAEELPVLTSTELEEISDPNIIINKMITLETQCAQMKPNLGAIAEYKKKVCRNINRHAHKRCLWYILHWCFIQHVLLCVFRRSCTCSAWLSWTRSPQRGTHSSAALRTCANSGSTSSWPDLTWSQTSWRKTTRCSHWVEMRSWNSWTAWILSLRASCSGNRRENKQIWKPKGSFCWSIIFCCSSPAVCVLQRRAGKRSLTCQEEKRPSAPWRWCLPCTTINPHRSTSWMRLMLLLISRMSPLLPVTFMWVFFITFLVAKWCNMSWRA